MSHKSRHKRELYELPIAMWKKIYEAAKLCTRHSEHPRAPESRHRFSHPRLPIHAVGKQQTTNTKQQTANTGRHGVRGAACREVYSLQC